MFYIAFHSVLENYCGEFVNTAYLRKRELERALTAFLKTSFVTFCELSTNYVILSENQYNKYINYIYTHTHSYMNIKIVNIFYV